MLNLSMLRLVFCTGVTFLVLSCITSAVRADSCALTQLTELPIEGNAIGSPIVKILLDDQPRRVLIDTGGFWSLIDPASASAYHPQSAEIVGLLGLGGYRLDRYVVVPSVQLGIAKFFRAGFYLEPSEYGVGVDATLGANWLQAFDLEIDPVRNVVALFTQKHCEGQVVYWPHTDMAELPIKIDHNQKTITVPVALDGQQIEATIDTGSPETYMSMRLAKSLFDLTEKSPGMIESATSTNRFGKTETRYRYQFKSLSIGDVTFNHPMVSLAEMSRGGTDLILGMHQLHGLHLYFAYGEKKLYVTSASGDVAARKAAGGGMGKSPLNVDPLARINALNLLDVALAFDRKNDRPAAEGAIDKAVSVDPTYAYAYLQRAKFRFQAGKRDDATKDMETAVKLAPDDPEIWDTQAQIYSLSGDSERAYESASKVFSLNPSSLSALNARCWFGAIAGHYEAALADCNTAIALDPHATSVLDSRAFVYLKMGRFQDAIDGYSKVLDLDRDMASSYYGRGLANQKAGNKSDGDDDITTAKRIDPEIDKTFGK
jgi:tetratricopeptide (TPR) repeat protein